MNRMDIICIVIAVFAVVLAVVVVVRNRAKTKHTIEKLDVMLDAAINASFTESTFDESTLSALETKLGKYLSQCSFSSKNLLAEKDKIKTLISDISHQTKTPIANILLYAQLLGEHEMHDDSKVCVKSLAANYWYNREADTPYYPRTGADSFRYRNTNRINCRVFYRKISRPFYYEQFLICRE